MKRGTNLKYARQAWDLLVEEVIDPYLKQSNSEEISLPVTVDNNQLAYYVNKLCNASFEDLSEITEDGRVYINLGDLRDYIALFLEDLLDEQGEKANRS
jgi:hypothetical protein